MATIGHPDDALATELTDLTLALVAQDSSNPPGDEKAVAEVLEQFIGGGSEIEVTMFEPAKNRQTFVAAVGTGRPCLVLAAHTDTHAVGTGWRRNPLGERGPDGRIFGRGTTDNKGAVAAMALAFKSLARLSSSNHGRLLFVGNADEETGGAEGVAALCSSWSERPDAAVVAEASGIYKAWERLWIASRGTSRFTIRVRGTPTHSSLAGQAGIGDAIEVLNALISELRVRLEILRPGNARYGLENRLTMVRVEAGEGWGSLAGKAEADCELRVLPPRTQAEVEAQVLHAMEGSRLALKANASLEFAKGGLRWMAPSEAGVETEIVQAASNAWTEVHGTAPDVGCFPGGTDARLFQEAGVPCVVIGPGALERAHHTDEFVTAEELVAAYRLYLKLAARFLRWEGLHGGAPTVD